MVMDASSLQSVSTLQVVVTMLSVWHEHTASVCKACPTIAVDTMHIRFGVTILPFAAAFAVLLCTFCAWNSLAATVRADLSSKD